MHTYAYIKHIQTGPRARTLIVQYLPMKSLWEKLVLWTNTIPRWVKKEPDQLPVKKYFGASQIKVQSLPCHSSTSPVGFREVQEAFKRSTRQTEQRRCKSTKKKHQVSLPSFSVGFPPCLQTEHRGRPRNKHTKSPNPTPAAPGQEIRVSPQTGKVN